MQHAIAASRMPVMYFSFDHNDASRSVILAFSAVFLHGFGVFTILQLINHTQGNLEECAEVSRIIVTRTPMGSSRKDQRCYRSMAHEQEYKLAD